MKFLIAVFVLLVGGTIGFLAVLQNGALLRFLDAHPHPRVVPTVEYSLASGYYLLNDLQNAATYYQRIAEQYPQSTLADDSYFNYLQSLEEGNLNRDDLVKGYETYLEKYPNGKHLEVVTKRIEYSKNRH